LERESERCEKASRAFDDKDSDQEDKVREKEKAREAKLRRGEWAPLSRAAWGCRLGT